MDNFFDIIVPYDSDEYHFSAELIPTACSYKIEVDIFGKIISFEPDEERNFRALIKPEDLQKTDTIHKPLLEAIANQLILLFKD